MSDGNMLRRHLRPAVLKLGIDPKKATWSSLRTSCATWLVQAGADPKAVQGQMRLSRISTTMDIYTQHVPEAQRNAVAKMMVLLLLCLYPGPPGFLGSRNPGTTGGAHMARSPLSGAAVRGTSGSRLPSLPFSPTCLLRCRDSSPSRCRHMAWAAYAPDRALSRTRSRIPRVSGLPPARMVRAACNR
jgi:hypothetical protein